MSEKETRSRVTLPCGWGRLLFAHTFPDSDSIAEAILEEKEGQRDIAFYIPDPHLVLNYAPQRLFLDPSNTYRLEFENYEVSDREPMGFSIRRIEHKEEIDDINRIYESHKMVPLDPEFVWQNRDSDQFMYVVAVAEDSGAILGAAMGVDHMACFDDLRNGCSLWALGVDSQAEFPGVGEWIVRYLVETYRERGRKELDLSVMHDNKAAVHLYKKLGFQKVSVFAVKCRNLINEKLFVGDPPEQGYNPYAAIIIREAMRRGIHIEPLDPKRGYFRLSLGGRSLTCRESLSELTSAIALCRADDKQLTREILYQADLKVPAQIVDDDWQRSVDFLNRFKSIVVKPMHGEQGQGISVDIRTPSELESALSLARQYDETVLIEQFVDGDDLRIIVINNEVVAAAIRKPATIVGTGEHTIRELIERLSRRRSAATGGESRIPQDRETERCIASAGYTYDDVLPAEAYLPVRKTANLHTGGTIHDVTAKLNPKLGSAAVFAARALEIPVVGFDFIVPDIEKEDYVIIEANERPGLANHEPQPTAEKFVDFLFPNTTSPHTVG